MTIPSTYDTDFLYTTLAGIVADSQEIIDQIIDDLTVNLPVDSRWTDLGGGQYQSPIQDPGGANRFMTVTLSRVSGTRIGFLVKDQALGTVMNGTFDNVLGPVESRIFTGPYHCIVENHNVGVSFQHGMAFMTDPGVFGLGSTNVFVAARTSRDSGGSQFGTQPNNSYAMRDGAGASTLSERSGGFASGGPNTVIVATTTAGSIVAIPLDISSNWGGGVQRYSGRAYQVICLNRNFIGPGIDVPLDESVVGSFRGLVLGGVASNSENIAIAVRTG